MGFWKLNKEILIDNISYHIICGDGFPCCLTASHVFISRDRILERTLEPVGEKEKTIANKKVLELVYKSNPVIIVFYSLGTHELCGDIELFNHYLKNKLKCPYVIGGFNRCGASFQKGKIFMEDNQCFCVALFEKKLEEVINFAVSFVHETKRVGALLVGKTLGCSTITIESDEFRKLSEGIVVYNN